MLACAIPFFYGDLDHVPLILAAIAVGTVGGVYGARTVQMTQMPQMVALFNGVGGGAAALVALLELHEIVELSDAGFDAQEFTLVATAFTILVGSVSFAGSIVTFAKLQELMTSRPVVFPGLPILFGGGFLGAVVLSVLLVREPDHVGWASCWRCSACWSASCWCCRSAAPTCRSSSRCSTRSPASPSPPAATCCPTRCCWSPAPWSARPARSSPC